MKKALGFLFLFSFFIWKPSWGSVYSVGLDKTQYTSDFMIGSIVVSIIFPESDGTIDPNIENWSDDRKSQVISKIMSGLDWWTRQNPKSKVTFTYLTQTVPTKYEPITRPYYDESLWISDIMGKLGYNGDRWTSTRKYVNDLRTQYNTDWGFVIFVVDSLVDTNGKFADGFFAYSYLGGPFTVMTYDNDGYGIGNMDVVVAHETGHIFHALDEYAGASSPNSYTTGYFPTINGNHVYSTIANDPNSIMRGGIRWSVDQWTKQAIGWRDSDSNGRDDIVDQSPILSLSQQAQASSDGNTGFNGTAKVRVLPRQSNSNGYGFTVDSISKVEYRPKNGTWDQADPTGGGFGAPEVSFHIPIPSNQASLGTQATISSNDYDVRVITAYSSYLGIVESSNGSGSLSDAHAYPNPFKPNSEPNHTFVKFTSMTPGAKVQVFSPAGERVFENTADANGEAEWTNVKNMNSGIYYFLITNSDGQNKKGKLAVIK